MRANTVFDAEVVLQDALAIEIAKELLSARTITADEELLKKLLSRDTNRDNLFRRGVDISIIYEILKMAEKNDGH